MSIGRTSHVGRWRTAVTLVAAIAAALSVDVPPARAQGRTGTISGVVRGASGAVLPGVTGALATGAGDVAQPAAMNSAFVSSKGAATKSNTLKISANTMELAAAAVVPFFNSSRDRFCVGTGNRPGTAPVTGD